MSNKKITETQFKNFLAYDSNYNKLKNLALNLFIWEGLPNGEGDGVGVNVEYLEETLHEHGLVVFAKDDNLGYLALKGVSNNGMNIYNKPTHYTLNGINYVKTFNVEDVVPIKNNALMVSTFRVLEDYALKMGDVQRTIDVLLTAHKSPFIIVADDKTALSFKTAFKLIELNEPMVVIDKGMGIDNVKALLTQTPFIIDKLYDYKNNLYMEALTFLGIDNFNIDKKERVIVDEANANNDLINQNAEIMLNARKKAVDEINKKFNLNITVKLRNDKVVSTYDKEEVNNNELQN